LSWLKRPSQYKVTALWLKVEMALLNPMQFRISCDTDGRETKTVVPR